MGQEEVCSLLLHCEADINACNTYGETPLHIAVRQNYDVHVELLRHLRKESLHGKKEYEIKEKIKPCFTILLEHNANVNAQNTLGMTPLHYTISCPIIHYIVSEGDHYRSLPWTAKILLERGANVNARDKQGNTPLLLAIREKRQGIIPVLLKFGADPDLGDNKGITPRLHAGVSGLSQWLT
jgi:ankyrin repeat protein